MSARISLILLSLCVISSHDALAQSSHPEVGYVRILNLITLSEPSYVAMGELILNDGEPLSIGDNSGIIAIFPGNHSLEIRNATATPKVFRMELKVESGKVLTVTSYDAATDQSAGALGPSRIRCHLMSEEATKSDSEPRLSLVSFLKSPLIQVNVSGHLVTLSPQQEYQAPVIDGKEIRVSVQNQLLETWRAEKSIHYLAFLYRESKTERLKIALLENRALRPDAPIASENSTAP